jgi:hypothetical protein
MFLRRDLPRSVVARNVTGYHVPVPGPLPRNGVRALTAAERMRAYRERLKAAADAKIRAPIGRPAVADPDGRSPALGRPRNCPPTTTGGRRSSPPRAGSVRGCGALNRRSPVGPALATALYDRQVALRA